VARAQFSTRGSELQRAEPGGPRATGVAGASRCRPRRCDHPSTPIPKASTHPQGALTHGPLLLADDVPVKVVSGATGPRQPHDHAHRLPARAPRHGSRGRGALRRPARRL